MTCYISSHERNRISEHRLTLAEVLAWMLVADGLVEAKRPRCAPSANCTVIKDASAGGDRRPEMA
jgi:hypothetical protein